MWASTSKIVELVGTSNAFGEEAARNAVETAGKSLRTLRMAEVTKLNMNIEAGKVAAYRTKLQLSFK